MPVSGTLATLRKIFLQYKTLGDKAMTQVADADLYHIPIPGADGNSISILVQHLAGNMRSRFTDFLTTDGEKPWRQRDREFEGGHASRADLMQDWENGWQVFFAAIDPLTEADLDRNVLIRNEPHSVEEALLRQLAHYSYHVGQIVLLARGFVGEAWVSLSIPRGGSDKFNTEKFSGRH